MKSTNSAKVKTKLDALKAFYRMYTAGLNRSEIESLLKRESLDVFSYYKKTIPRSEGDVSDKSPWKQLKVLRELFLSFVLNLTPARRLFYGLAIIVFMTGIVVSNWYYAFFSFLLLNLLLAFELADKMLTKDDLEIAREIQNGLQPQHDPEIDGLDIAAFYHAAKVVGGDYYDFIEIDKNRIALIVGDVSGKGMPAALYAVRLQGLFEFATKHSHSPKEMCTAINEIMTQRLNKKYFITAVVAVFDLAERKLHFARAGHPPPICYRADAKELSLLSPAGLGIGLDGNGFCEKLVEKCVSFDDDDVFLFYTDGITEAMDADKKEFGESRLGKVLLEHAQMPANAIKDEIVSALYTFVKKILLDDDATLVVVKVKPVRS